MFTKINILRIFEQHFASLKNDNTQKPELGDYITFFGLPAIITIALLWFNIVLSNDALNTIIATLSILVGLLFNVIVLVFDIIKRDNTNSIKNELLEEMLANISYTIVLSLIAIVASLFTYIDGIVAKNFFSGIVYFLLCNFLFTVLMVLKRMFKLFENEMTEIEKSPKKSND